MPNAALITGGAKRIGRAIALALAGEGYDLAIHYNTSAAEAEELAGQVVAAGRRCELLSCDLADTGRLAAMMEEAFRRLPHLSALVNNASIFERGTFLETDEAFLDRAMAVNFKAPFFLCQAFARRARAGGIVNILDTNVTRNVASYFAYSLSKKALRDLTLLAARALAPGIRVNAVCPGAILPPPGEPPEYLDKLISKVPLQRAGDGGQIAAAVLYLLRSDYVTGQCLFVDGGRHLV